MLVWSVELSAELLKNFIYVVDRIRLDTKIIDLVILVKPMLLQPHHKPDAVELDLA